MRIADRFPLAAPTGPGPLGAWIADRFLLSLDRFCLDILPEVPLPFLDGFIFGIEIDFPDDLIDLFKLEIDDIIHYPLCLMYIFDK